MRLPDTRGFGSEIFLRGTWESWISRIKTQILDVLIKSLSDDFLDSESCSVGEFFGADSCAMTVILFLLCFHIVRHFFFAFNETVL